MVLRIFVTEIAFFSNKTTKLPNKSTVSNKVTKPIFDYCKVIKNSFSKNANIQNNKYYGVARVS